MPLIRRAPHQHPTDPNAIAAARRHGNPDPRTHQRTHELAEHAQARADIDTVLGWINDLPNHQEAETRIEVIRRVPPGFLGRRPRQTNSFSLIQYAYGVEPRGVPQPQYVIDRALTGYVILSPLATPTEREVSRRGVRGRHQDLVIASDGESSWAGALHAYVDPAQAGAFEPAVAVGRDIDVLGLGESSDRAIDMMASVEPGRVTPRRTALLHQIAQGLLELYYQVDGAPDLATPVPPHP